MSAILLNAPSTDGTEMKWDSIMNEESFKTEGDETITIKKTVKESSECKETTELKEILRDDLMTRETLFIKESSLDIITESLKEIIEIKSNKTLSKTSSLTTRKKQRPPANLAESVNPASFVNSVVPVLAWNHMNPEVKMPISNQDDFPKRQIILNSFKKEPELFTLSKEQLYRDLTESLEDVIFENPGLKKLHAFNFFKEFYGDKVRLQGSVFRNPKELKEISDDFAQLVWKKHKPLMITFHPYGFETVNGVKSWPALFIHRKRNPEEPEFI
jgi:hypothetical protein